MANKVKITYGVEVVVDLDDWALEYGLETAREAMLDAERYLKILIQNSSISAGWLSSLPPTTSRRGHCDCPIRGVRLALGRLDSVRRRGCHYRHPGRGGGV